ncbi:cyclase [Candidatus Poribacteria bacterium]|nr:cyclase [Candidatus Poribacteria bacterium]
MATVFLKHEVADYSAWKPLYDADLPRRNAAGLKEIGVYREASDENMVVVIFEVENPEVIKEFLQSEDLAEKMKEAGVLTKPEVWVGNPIG